MVKKGVFLLVVFFVLFPFVINAENDSLPNFEYEKDSITPPPPPEEAFEDVFILSLKLKEYTTKSLIFDIHVEIEIYNKESKKGIKTLQYVDEGGTLGLSLEKGKYTIIFKIDNIATEGKDYFIASDYDVNKDLNETLYLLPVGSIRGVVYDETEKTIRNAEVKFDCPGNYGIKNSVLTDSSGSFTSYWLPVGSCKISALYGNMAGYKVINIEEGKINEVEIYLNKKVMSNYYWVYIIAAVIILAVISLRLYKAKKEIKLKVKEKKKKELKEGTEKREAEKKDDSKKQIWLSRRSQDLMQTLKKREKEIVSFLLENNFKATQSQIRYDLGIPKTSLTRLLDGLVLKKILEIEKVGKLKKVRLTDWFLGKS